MRILKIDAHSQVSPHSGVVDYKNSLPTSRKLKMCIDTQFHHGNSYSAYMLLVNYVLKSIISILFLKIMRILNLILIHKFLHTLELGTTRTALPTNRTFKMCIDTQFHHGNLYSAYMFSVNYVLRSIISIFFLKITRILKFDAHSQVSPHS